MNHSRVIRDCSQTTFWKRRHFVVKKLSNAVESQCVLMFIDEIYKDGNAIGWKSH